MDLFRIYMHTHLGIYEDHARGIKISSQNLQKDINLQKMDLSPIDFQNELKRRAWNYRSFCGEATLN